jgi:hypothetical protein
LNHFFNENKIKIETKKIVGIWGKILDVLGKKPLTSPDLIEFISQFLLPHLPRVEIFLVL